MIYTLSFSEADGHADTEDAFLLLPHPLAADCVLCALADGQGGQPGGGLAARLACRTCLDLASARPPGELAGPLRWLEVLYEVDRVVSREPGAGLTTLVAFAVRGD